MIYQDLALCGDLDVAANVFLGRELRRRYRPDPLARPAARCGRGRSG